MLVEASVEMAKKVFGRRQDVLALANPTAVRFLVKAVDELGPDLQESLKGVNIATVGPATAKVASSYVLVPNIVSKGHIIDLAEALVKDIPSLRNSARSEITAFLKPLDIWGLRKVAFSSSEAIDTQFFESL